MKQEDVSVSGQTAQDVQGTADFADLTELVNAAKAAHATALRVSNVNARRDGLALANCAALVADAQGMALLAHEAVRMADALERLADAWELATPGGWLRVEDGKP